MASVELKDIRKSYAALDVIHGISLDIADGEFIALVGPSGCGKSTLLRMIAGLEEITDGDILIGDKVVNGMTPRERNIAMVFQSYALYPHMTVAENMGFNLKLAGQPKNIIEERVAEAARMLDLGKLALSLYIAEPDCGHRAYPVAHHRAWRFQDAGRPARQPVRHSGRMAMG